LRIYFTDAISTDYNTSNTYLVYGNMANHEFNLDAPPILN